jgi:two-component system, OmpR family, osmolarity sensor histidine kinase EnvZ
VTRQLSENLAGDVAWDVALYRADPSPQELARIAEWAERAQSLSVAYYADRPVPTAPRPSLFPTFDDALRAALDTRLDERVWVDATRYPAYVDIRVAVRGGTLRFIAPRERAFAAPGYVFLLWLTGATFLLTAIAVVFIRNQVRAIERLAAAADAFGRGQDAPHFKPHGAREVRQAAEAFIAMRGRIRRHIEQRTALLASVSHDLRTPLTRLKLQAALAEPSPRLNDIKRDLSEMEHMIDEYLAFARGQEGEAVREAPLKPLLEEVRADAQRTGAEVAVDADPALAVAVRPKAFKRALSNLVQNAAAHGEHVRVQARRTPFGGLEISVDDDGPGIAPEDYEEAFRPFGRLDPSRNQNAKGVGLGLAIARDVARGHGGDVELDKSPLGGLRATVRLPG